MPVLDYTTAADIRAVLGVSDIELKDETLALEVYASNLNAELEEVGTTLPTKYAEVSGTQADARTPEQRRFFETTRLFAAYAVAKQCTSSLPMFSPKDISDSKTLMGRFSDSPYKETTKRVCAGYDLNKTRLANAFAALSQTTGALPQRVLMAVSSPSTDRVTG